MATDPEKADVSMGSGDELNETGEGVADKGAQDEPKIQMIVVSFHLRENFLKILKICEAGVQVSYFHNRPCHKIISILLWFAELRR